MISHSKHRRPDPLTTLLFRLPAELRLQIYEYLVPEASILLVPETSIWDLRWGTPGSSNRNPLRWLGISREVFLDAGHMFYGAKPLYFWIDAWSDGKARSLDDALLHHVKAIHPHDYKWTFEQIRSSMVTKIMLEVQATTFGENLQSLLLRFARYANQFRRYTALEELYVSLRPHYNNAHHKLLFRYFKEKGNMQMKEKRMKESWTLRRLCCAVREIKQHVPLFCKVQWHIPGKRCPKVTHRRRDWSLEGYSYSEHEMTVLEFMENLWEFVYEHTDGQLDDLLSEQEQGAWRT